MWKWQVPPKVWSFYEKNGEGVTDSGSKICSSPGTGFYFIFILDCVQSFSKIILLEVKHTHTKVGL